MNPEGTIKKVAEGFLVLLPYQDYYNLSDGVTILETDDGKVYQKLFRRKKIYLPDQYAQAVTEILTGKDVVVMGMNGYSSITPDQCANWGIKPGAYEAACEKLLYETILTMQQTYPGIDVRVADGASLVGVDMAALKVCERLNRPHLGHSCPKFMPYVVDDDLPVYVGASQGEYAESFIKSLDILIAANGRQQAFQHDIDAAFRFLKQVIPINVVKSISVNGGPQAISAKGKIEDAVAAFERLIHPVNIQTNDIGYDAYAELCSRVKQTVVQITRPLLSPARAYQV